VATDQPSGVGGFLGDDDNITDNIRYDDQETQDMGAAGFGPDIFEPGETSGLTGDGPLAGGRGNPRVAPVPWDQEPSAIVSRYLFPTERFRGEWRKHWIHIIKQLAIAAGATVLTGWIAGVMAKHDQPGLVTFTLLVLLFILGWVGWQVGDWYLDRFILTNKRIMEVKGIVTKTVAMMPLLRVTDMKYTQSPLGRIFGYGDFELESAGQDQALRKIDNLPDPNELYLRIVEEMYEPEAVEARAMAAPNEPGGIDDGM
jgi:membrane protein YdbS with pleckstrin-like domain